MRYQFIDRLRGTRVMPAYKTLSSIDSTSEELRAFQTQRLGKFLVAIKKDNPLYRNLLSEFSTSAIRENPCTVLEALPQVDKEFIAQNREDLFVPVQDRPWQHKKTGGSTGEPFKYAIDLESVSESWAYILSCWTRYAGYQPGDPYVTVAGSSLGATGHRLKTKTYRILQNNYLIPGDVISCNMKLDRARIRRARLLFCYPSSLMALLQTIPGIFAEHRMKAVFTTSEQLQPQARKFIEEQLNIPVFDMYGANDGGLISCECTEHAGFHYDPLNCYVEAVKNGETGQSELLLTGLTSIGFPFVRYRVGDVAELSDFGSCRCGNPFPMIIGLAGRTRDVLHLKDHRIVHGVVFNHLFYDFPEVRRYRIVQAENYQITIMLDIEDFAGWQASTSHGRMERELESYLRGTPYDVIPMDELSLGNRKLKLIESHVS